MAFDAEIGMLGNLDGDKRIARLAAEGACHALPFQPDLLAVFDPGGHGDFERAIGRQRHAHFGAMRRFGQSNGHLRRHIFAARCLPAAALRAGARPPPRRAWPPNSSLKRSLASKPPPPGPPPVLNS